MELPIKDESGSCILDIKVVPGSSRTKISGLLGDALKVTVAAAPEKGKANKELIKYLAKTLDISKSSITIVAGEKDHRKSVQIEGINIVTLKNILSGLL